MAKRYCQRLLSLIVFVAIISLPVSGQVKSNQNLDRLLKSLNDKSWLIAETRYGLNYRTGYLDLTQVTANSPKTELGNHWYWLIYPLSNIDNLWDGDLQLFADSFDDASNQPRTSWSHVSRYLASEQRCVYMLMPKVSVMGGRIYANRTTKGQYDFGSHLRVVDLRVRKDRLKDFEDFALNQMLPSANRALAGTNASTKLPRFIRTLKIEVNMKWEPKFHEFVKKKLVPTAIKTKTDFFLYHTIYGSEANYMFVFPFEKETDLAATGERVLSAMWQKGHPYFKTLQLDGEFSQMIIGAQEMITRIRPDLSPGFSKKQTR